MQTYSEATLNRFYKYALHDDFEFNTLTDDHQEMIECIMKDKLGNALIREKIVCKVLGVTHNPNMFSTFDGYTTFDGTHPITNKHHEVKTEQYTSGNEGRKSGDNGQLAGVGIFGGMKNDLDMVRSLIDGDPVISHGMFADGRLLVICTFQLSNAPNAVERMLDYASRPTKTAVRYMYSDWIYAKGLRVEYLSPNWPRHIAPKYRTAFTHIYQKQSIVDAVNFCADLVILHDGNIDYIETDLSDYVVGKKITEYGLAYLYKNKLITRMIKSLQDPLVRDKIESSQGQHLIA